MVAREADFLYVDRAAEGGNEADGPFSSACLEVVSAARRPIKTAQMRGAARWSHGRRTSCTLTVRPRAATKQMGRFHRPAWRSSRLLVGRSKRLRCEAPP